MSMEYILAEPPVAGTGGWLRYATSGPTKKSGIRRFQGPREVRRAQSKLEAYIKRVTSDRTAEGRNTWNGRPKLLAKYDRHWPATEEKPNRHVVYKI